MPTDPVALGHELATRGLSMVGAFVPIALANLETHAAGAETAVKTAVLMRAAGAADALIVLADDNASVPARERHAGRIGREHGLSERQWDTFAAGADLVARAVAERTGLRTVFHPHCGGYVETPLEIDTLLRRTDPARLGLVLDTGHIVYGGGDPLTVLKGQQDPCRHAHFKN